MGDKQGLRKASTFGMDKRVKDCAHLFGDKRMLRKLSLILWVFVLDHTHYAWNLPIHLRDMARLEELHPVLYVEFQRCHFMGQKSWRAFSNIPRDQMHEQLIDCLKNHAGVIENLDDPSTVLREQVIRPELARLVIEFEGTDESD